MNPLLGAACVSDFGTPPDTTSLRERIAIALWTLHAVFVIVFLGVCCGYFNFDAGETEELSS